MSRVTEKHKIDDEDAGQLKFGGVRPHRHGRLLTGSDGHADFADQATQSNMLTISEVRLLLDNIPQNHVPDNAIYNKTRDYVDTFARFNDPEVVAAVRQSLPADDFHFYETVQLANLCPMESEEAKALIPSIKMEDDALQAHLDELANIRKHQG
ncbi:hypothetical protein JCM10207_008806 [Rhodosporidiobolus poonsookiae]